MNELNESAHQWLMDKPAKQEKPILTMPEWIREWMMVRFQRHMNISNLKWNGRICSRIKKIIDKHVDNVIYCIPINGDNTQYQINYRDGSQYTMNLGEISCSCKLWGLSGIPCKHDICAINHQRADIEDYVHESYIVEVYRKSYAHTIKGINDYAIWGETAFIPLLSPTMGR
ncbi:hypothetical protein ACS0TY_031312 [Phlomoides rotata]